MKIIVEKNIPFIKGLLEPVAEVLYLAPEEITAESMRDADALVTRTRTRCDANLLEGSKCRFIATATIGTDHIDLDYCRKAGIAVANAPGCNAPGVAQYVYASIAALREARGDTRPVDTLTIGVVGVGHVGSIVADWGRTIGMKVLCCDPPRAEKEGGDSFCDMDTIARECDIITFHTPLTKEGCHPTYHLFDNRLAAKLQHTPIVINSARGPVTDTQALITALDNGMISAAVIDCWENEPAISPQLLDRAAIATPHIAGYSREGKIRATAMAVAALTRFFGLPCISPSEKVPEGAACHVTMEPIAASYSPMADTAALKSRPQDFEALRNGYNYRNEVPEA